MSKAPILVIGATGYVGGRLVPRLVEAGYRVRAMARSMAKIRSRPWGEDPVVEPVQADVMDPDALRQAVSGCRAIYYLVHFSTGSEREQAEKAARNLIEAASFHGVGRVICLEWLGIEPPDLKILRSGPVPATVLRAPMILGSGCASFEILRYLVDRLPVMIAPGWLNTPCQPIAIRNVLHYLTACLEIKQTAGQTFDIGGPEVLSYLDLMKLYAEEAGLVRRLTISVPIQSAPLNAWWISLITPVPAAAAWDLTEAWHRPMVAADERIRTLIPQKLLGCRETIRLALERVQEELVETRWSDAGAVALPEWSLSGDVHYAGGAVVQCCYKVRMRATREEIWEPIARIGGIKGWYFGNFLWKLRGFLDRLVGGVGLDRGRRHPSELFVGDALDFWRVVEVDPPGRLVLVAEMKLPGEALMEFRILDLGDGTCELQQRSRFLPRGLAGLLYWYSMYPFHQLIFGNMLKNIADAMNHPITWGPEPFTPDPQESELMPSNAMDEKAPGMDDPKERTQTP